MPEGTLLQFQGEFFNGRVEKEGEGDERGNASRGKLEEHLVTLGKAAQVGQFKHLQVQPGWRAFLDVEEGTSKGMQDWETQWQGVLKTLQPLHSVMQEIMPPWDDCRAFLASFEQVAKACQWPKAEWADRLLPALSGEAEEAFRGLEAQDREDYGKVKAAIMRADALRMETQRQHFRDFSCQEIEDPRRLQSQVQELCHQWLRPERRSKEQILELLILEQFLASLPSDLQGWIRAGGPDTCSQAVALVEDFLMSQQVSAKGMRQGPLKEEGLDFSPAEEESLRAAKEELYRKSEQNSSGEIALRGSGFRSPGGRSPLLPPEGQESIPSDVKTEPVDLKEASHSLRIVKQSLSKPGQQTTIWQVLQENEAKTSSLGDVKGREVKMETSQYGGNEPEGIAVSQGCVSGAAQMFEEKGKYTVEQPLRRENGNYETRDGLLAAIHPPSEIQNLHEMPFLRESERKYQHTLEHDMVHTNQDHGECAMTGEDFQKNVYSDKYQRMVEGEARSEFTMEGQRDIFNKQLSDHKEEIPNQPSEFGDSFEYTKPLKKKKGVENEGGLYECPHCRKCFRCEEELMDHQQLHTGEERQDHIDSGQVVPFTELLIRDQGIHPPVGPYVCCQCGKSFNQRRHLENHQRTHTGVKPYTCSQCGKCFNQRRYLKIHQRIHTGEKPYKCSECGKKFIRGQCLKNHQRTHAGDKPYACSQCGKCFNQIRYLKTHQRIHAELKPYKCLQCGRSFTQRGALINHQKIHTRRNCINDLS